MQDYCNNPDKDFTRNRKLTIEKITAIRFDHRLCPTS